MLTFAKSLLASTTTTIMMTMICLMTMTALHITAQGTTTLPSSMLHPPLHPFDGSLHLKKNQVLFVCNDPHGSPDHNVTACYRNQFGNFYIDCDIPNQRIRLFNCSNAPHCDANCNLVQTISRHDPTESKLLEFADKPEDQDKRGSEEHDDDLSSMPPSTTPPPLFGPPGGTTLPPPINLPRYIRPRFNFSDFFNATSNHTTMITRMDFRPVNESLTPGAIDNCSHQALGTVNFIIGEPHICIPPPPQQPSPEMMLQMLGLPSMPPSTTTLPPSTTLAPLDERNLTKQHFWNRISCNPDTGDIIVESFAGEGCMPHTSVHNNSFANDTCVNATVRPGLLPDPLYNYSTSSIDTTRFECRLVPEFAQTFVALINVEFPLPDEDELGLGGPHHPGDFNGASTNVQQQQSLFIGLMISLVVFIFAAMI